MRKSRVIVLMLVIVAGLAAAVAVESSATVVTRLSTASLAFTKNMGQWDERVLFRANSGSATMWFTREGVTYQFTRHINKSGSVSTPYVGQAPSALTSLDSRFRGNDSEPDSIEQLVLTAEFVGANPNPEVVGEGRMEYKCNYFIGNDPSEWHTDVPNYAAILLKDIYPGIDLKYSGDGNRQAAYEFILAPGADIAQIKVKYEGAEKTSIDAEGRMVLRTKWGDMIAAIKSPTNGALSGTGSFSLLSKKTIGFDADGSNRQVLATLAVGLVYSTYLGGSGEDEGHGIAVDESGSAYLTGRTWSTDFPIQNPFQPAYSENYDAFVTKFDPSGSTLVYSTYLGGHDQDDVHGIAVDKSGDACVVGSTISTDFPTQNPYQPTNNGDYYDVFVTKLNPSGNSLAFSTYLGGNANDQGNGIAIDDSGNVYLSGETWSDDFPIQDPYQSTIHGLSDVFVTKFNAIGTALVYSSYLGGSGSDWGYGVALDSSGFAYVTGYTRSLDFPMQDPYQPINQSGEWGWDVFVTKLKPAGNALVFSTYLGGSSVDRCYGIAVDAKGNVYLTGETASNDFPIQDPLQSTINEGYDGFVIKLNSSGTALVFSTYLGGNSDETGYSITVDKNGSAYVAGRTASSDFPLFNPLQSTDPVYYDAFVTVLNSTGGALVFSSFFGGNGQDYARAITGDSVGNVYVTGQTSSTDFPVQNSYQLTTHGGFEAFVTKLGGFPLFLCGDADHSESVDLSDAVYLIGYIFAGGPEPSPYLSGDADCSGDVDISDAVYLIAYIFADGPVPCEECK